MVIEAVVILVNLAIIAIFALDHFVFPVYIVSIISLFRDLVNVQAILVLLRANALQEVCTYASHPFVFKLALVAERAHGFIELNAYLFLWSFHLLKSNFIKFIKKCA